MIFFDCVKMQKLSGAVYTPHLYRNRQGLVMNIQIFGTKKCNNTKKAQRFFKERGIKFHLVDLNDKGLSQGELRNIIKSIAPDDLIDKDGKEYKKLNLEYIQHNIEEKLLEHPLLLKTPVVRNGNNATVGYNPEKWKEWSDK